MEVTQVQVGTDNVVEHVKVTVQRTVGVDRRYRINSSYGYAGIMEGIVEVTHILSKDDLTNIDGDSSEELQDIMGQVESHKEVELQAYIGNPEYGEALERLDNTHWVAYKYPYGEEEGICVLDIELFLDHTSMV
jgi:hypothetical protein